ncbi:MAG: hypothetical protein PHZ00_01520, partial [Candidatus Peribacteraceae bacterium]|nr:hypothetical protein [Candidatus Peribacteraceae bacterium]
MNVLPRQSSLFGRLDSPPGQTEHGGIISPTPMPHGFSSTQPDQIDQQSALSDHRKSSHPVPPEAMSAATAASTWRQVLTVLSNGLMKHRNGNRKRRPVSCRSRNLGAEMMEQRILLAGDDDSAAEVGMPLAGEGEAANVTEDPVASLRRRIAEVENNRETVSVTPGLTITAYQNDPANLTLNYSSMPEDIAFRFADKTLLFQKGSGSVKFPLAGISPGGRTVYSCQLIRQSTGEVIYGELGGFGVAGGGHTYAGYGYDPAAPFPSLTKLSRTEILPLTAEKVAQIDALKKELAALE